MATEKGDKKGVFQGILSYFSGEKPPAGEDAGREIALIISKHQFHALESSFDERMSKFEKRMQQLEGGYGAQIGALQIEKAALVEELSEAQGELEEATSREAQLRAVRTQIPGVLQQLGFSEGDIQKASAGLMDARATAKLNELLETHFPGIPVTAEGLVALAPLIIGLLGSFGLKPQKAAPAGGNQQTLATDGTTFQ
jgi:hypothetical protein